MSSRTTLRVAIPLALLALSGAISGLVGWPRPGLARAQERTGAAKSVAPEAARKAQQPEDEKAIRAVDEAFARDYNKGDGKAVAAYFTEDAEVVEAEGDRYEGRALIESRLADTFAANPGARIALEVGAIRFLSPDAAKEEGRSVVTPAKGAPVSRYYTALYVKRGGRWLIDSVREEEDPMVRPHDRLRDLDWMVGDWVDEGSEAVVRVNCRWSDDGNFLIRDFTVKRQGKPVISITQRVGWDPLAKQIRSWEFDSEGGFGEGRWSHDGDRWVVKQTGVRPEGVLASATNVTVRDRPDLVRWASTDRVVGGESVPGEQTFVMVRVPPAPHEPSKGQAKPSPSPNTERSPR
jgi:uncharacterized protein (TIGR02246 family)